MIPISEVTATDLFAQAAAKDFVFLCGAGISQNPPTRIPTVQSFIDALLNACGAASVIQRLVRERLTSRLVSPRFEVLIDEIAKLQDRGLKVARIFEARGFNNIHNYLGQMVLRGASVITTNFDNCIENSLAFANASYSRQVFDGEDLKRSPPLERCLVKIHGSNSLDASDPSRLLITIRALAETSGGFRRFPGWKNYLIELIKARVLTVFGYSGSDDFDITPIILRSHPAHVLWIVFDAEATVPEIIGRDEVDEKLRSFARNLPITFIKSRLELLVRDLQGSLGLVQNEYAEVLDGLRVADYVSDVYPNRSLREELLNVILLHFSLFDSVVGRPNAGRSPGLEIQRMKALYRLGKYREAIEIFETGEAESNDPSQRIQALYFYSASLYYSGRIDLAVHTAEALLLLCREIRDYVAEVNALTHLGGMYFTLGQDDRASESYSQVLELQEKQPVSIESEATAWWGLADVALRKGDTQSARPLYERTRKINLDLGNEANVAWLDHNLGETEIQDRKYDAAIAVLQQAEMRFRDLKSPSGLIYVLNAQAKAYYQKKDWQALRQKILDVINVLGRNPGEPIGSEVLVIVALYVMRSSDDDEIGAGARTLFEAVLDGRPENTTVAALKQALAENFPDSHVLNFERYLFTSSATL
jgi:tetratricopeptide (TPR) repeat protein